MADDGHTINVGPVTVGKIATGGRTGPQDPAPSGGSIDANAIRNEDGTWDDVLALCDEVDRLRDLLRRALPWIDPNDRHEDYLLTVAIREALGEPT